MKIRNGYVSNSSSSSFVCVYNTADTHEQCILFTGSHGTKISISIFDFIETIQVGGAVRSPFTSVEFFVDQHTVEEFSEEKLNPQQIELVGKVKAALDKDDDNIAVVFSTDINDILIDAMLQEFIAADIITLIDAADGARLEEPENEQQKLPLFD